MDENEMSTLTLEDKALFNKYVMKAKELATNGEIEDAIRYNKKAYHIAQVDKLARRIKKLEEHLATALDENRDDENDDGARRDKYLEKSKELSGQGKIAEAIKLCQKAQEIMHTDKIARRIKRMEDYLAAQEESEGDDDDLINLGDGFMIYKELAEKIYQHQKDGVLWMWKLHQRNKGGILADDMGLGKTIQVVAFLAGLFDMGLVKTVLIVLPVAVIVNWQREFEKWAPGINVCEFHGSSKRERERSLSKVHRRGGVLLTSYGLVVNCHEQLAQPEGMTFRWDYMVLDEGHKIKNTSTKCAKGVHYIKARHRLILTGTPIQNNMLELWSLFDWCHQGQLLGTMKTFKIEFEGPIKRAREKDATAGEQRFGQKMASILNQRIKPYLLRRTKGEVTKTKPKQNTEVVSPRSRHKVAEMPSFTRKNDLVCWVYLSDDQQRIYEEFARSDEVRELLNTSRSPLVALTVLKKICDHPRLLTNKQCHRLNLDMDEEFLKNEEAMPEHLGAQSAVERINKLSVDQLIAESGKMKFLVGLLDNLKAEGHRTLVFSMARRILDIVERVMTDRGHEVARLDGTVTKLEDREKIIKRFSKNKNISVFLLTTQVGGVGLTITAADRVVIFDPSWNPATDAQAVDRCFRIGQDKNVVVYRLITCGSIEEKIYRRQVFKDSINKQTQGDAKNPYRYFTKMELRDLFMLDNPRVSTTQRQIEDLHAHQRKTDTSLDGHIAFLMTLEMYGVSDHDLLFSKEAEPTEDHELVEDDPKNIENRAEIAERLLTHESEENKLRVEEMGYYPAPEVFKVAPPTTRQPPTRWNFPGMSTAEEDKDDSKVEESDDDSSVEEIIDDDVQVVLGSSMQEMNLEAQSHRSSDDGSFHDAADTPARGIPRAEETSVQKTMNYLEGFKMKERLYGTPNSDTSSPVTGTSENKMTPNSRGQTFFGKLAGFFSPSKPPPSAAAGSAKDLDSPVKKMVNDICENVPQEHANKGANLFGDINDDDEDVSMDSGATSEAIHMENSPEKEVSETASLSRTEPVEKSPVITIDDTPNTSPQPASNRFLQQAMLKAKKGSEAFPISVENTPAVNATETPSNTASRQESSTTPLRRPLENISNSPKRNPTIQSANTLEENSFDLDDEFDEDLPPVTPRSLKKNKRRSVCALPTPRRIDEMPVSPSGSPTSPPVNVIRQELIVSPKDYDPIVSMSPARMAGQRKLSAMEADMTVDGYDAFRSGAHVDSTILPDVAASSGKRGTLVSFCEEDENGVFSSPAGQGKKKKARTTPPDEYHQDTIVDRTREDETVSNLNFNANDSEDESTTPAMKKKASRNDSESDTGDTPVARTARRVIRSIESDEEMSDQDVVQDSEEDQDSSGVKTHHRPNRTLQAHLKTFIEDSADENEEESEDDEVMISAPATPHDKPRRTDEKGDESVRSAAGSGRGKHDESAQSSNRSESKENEDGSETEDEQEQSSEADDEDEDEESESEDEDEESESEDEFRPEDKEKYTKLFINSRAHYKAGNLQEALELAVEALQIYSGDERAKSYALKLQKLVKESEGK